MDEYIYRRKSTGLFGDWANTACVVKRAVHEIQLLDLILDFKI